MDEPVFADSALKHGLTRNAILHAFRNPNRASDLGDGMTMLIGRAPKADLLEVVAISGNEARVIVHAMPAGQRFLH